MVATRLQSAVGVDAGAATIVVGSGQGWATPTAGNLIVGWYNGDNVCGTPTGFTADGNVVDGNAVYLWYKIAAGTESSVSFVQTASTDGQCGLIEYSGIAASPGDGNNSSSIPGSLGTTTTSVSLTGTGTVGDLYVAIAGLHGFGSAAPTSPTWSNGFTNFANQGNGTPNTATYSHAFVADFQNTGAGAVSTAASWTNTAQDRQQVMAAFKLAAAPTEPVVGKKIGRANWPGAGPRGQARRFHHSRLASGPEAVVPVGQPPPFIGWGWGGRY